MDYIPEELTYDDGWDGAISYMKKSLRPQTIWKPSDEQMEALERMVNFAHFNEVDNRDIVRNLLFQLKKLREE